MTRKAAIIVLYFYCDVNIAEITPGRSDFRNIKSMISCVISEILKLANKCHNISVKQ